ncbi:response regulator [Allofournierella sp.]|uniref:response regulator n=1 Tax=Allofournierella sp. TaxID=1940256 RepID=UPI003AB1B2B4
MYKVLVADDDNMARLAMKTMLDWESCGFCLCGAAEGGEQALRLARELRPDLVITDVDMPGMNGLELIRRLRAAGLGCEVLLLSNYNDFSYVREGLREGALDYILKVELDQTTLLKALEKAAGTLRRRREHEPEGRPGEGAPLRLEELLGTAGGPQAAPPWQGAADLYYIQILPGGARPLKQTAIRRVCAGVLSGAGQAPFAALGEDAFLAADTERGTAPGQTMRRIETQLRLYLGYEAAVLCAPGVRGEQALAEARERLEAEMRGRLGTKRPPAPERRERAERLVQKFAFARYRNSEAELLEAVDRLFEALPLAFAGPGEAAAYLQEQITRAYWLVADRERLSLPGWLKRLEQAGSYEALHRETAAFAREYTLRPELRPEVRRVCEYIQQHLEQKITLDELAAEAGLKKSYLCTLFKASLGQSIGEYMLEQRLRRAEGLLTTTSLRIWEIGEKVGIPDPLYFSKVFKRRYGVAPSQFKR